MGLTLPTGIEKRVDDDFTYNFMKLSAHAELCFRPDEIQLGYWFANKTSTYLRNDGEPQRRGTAVLAPLHIFDVLDIAYTHPVVGYLTWYEQQQVICDPRAYRQLPIDFIWGFLCTYEVYPRWRLIGASRLSRDRRRLRRLTDRTPDEPRNGFAAAATETAAIKQTLYAPHIEKDWLDERKAQTYDRLCETHGKPTEQWLPNCTGPATTDERDYFAFEYDLREAWYREAAKEWEAYVAKRELL